MSRIYFDPIRADDGEPCVRATIIDYDARGDERARLSHVMTIVGAGIRMDDFAAMIADARSGAFVDDDLKAADILGESDPTGRML